MTPVITVLEARVAADRDADLQSAYAAAAAGPFPVGFVRSSLLRLPEDPTLWRIETTWVSREALVAMRGAGKPRGVQIFEAAGAVPTLTIFDEIARLEPSK
jgi:hypothetical protein